MRKCPQQFEIMLSRIYIVHAGLTHSHLMSRYNQQQMHKYGMWKTENEDQT